MVDGEVRDSDLILIEIGVQPETLPRCLGLCLAEDKRLRQPDRVCAIFIANFDGNVRETIPRKQIGTKLNLVDEI